MSDGVTCPECNSQDIQEVSVKKTTIEDEQGLNLMLIILLIVFWPIGLIYLIYKLLKKRKPMVETVETKTEFYYVCRSCGHKFRKS